MKINNLYETIFKRRSIRNYDLSTLDKTTMDGILDCLNDLKPLYDNIKVELKILKTDEVNRRMMKKAPYYLAIFSEKKDGYLENVGFMLQQFDLFLSANDIGCCWQGIPKPKKDVLDSTNLEYIILLAFGKPKETLHRQNISEFKRKSLDKITDIQDVEELLEPVRIAPSSTNRQPWFFGGNKNLIHAYCAKPNFLKAVFVRKFNHIDMGIALYHLSLSAKHLGLELEIIKDLDAQRRVPQGYEYITSIKLS